MATNIIDSILSGLINSVGDATSLAAESNRQMRNKSKSEYTPFFMDKTKFQDFQSDPTRYTLQKGAGLASLLVPGGGGILGSAVKGATAGGLYGFSQANKDNLLSDTLSGALLGGGTGAALSAAGKAVSKLKNSNAISKAGTKLESRGLNIEANVKSPMGRIESQNIKNAIVDDLRLAGKDLNLKGIEKRFPEINAIKQDLLAGSNAIIPKNQVTKEAIDTALLNIPNANAERIVPRVNQILNEVGDEISASQLGFLKSELFPYSKRAYNAETLGGSVSVDTQLKGIVHDIIDNKVKSMVPEAKPVYDIIEKYYQIAPDVVKRYDKGGAITAPLVGGVKVPTGNLVNELSRVAGKGLQKLSSIEIPNMSGLKNVPFPLLATMAGGGQGMSDTSAPSMMDYNTSQQDNGATQLAMELLSGGMKPSEVKTTLELLGLGGGKLTETQQKFAGAREQAQYALDLLDSGKVQPGKVSNLKSGVETFFGTQAPEVTDYQSSLALARTALKNALLGGAITPQEASSLESAIPDFSDEAGIAKQKLVSFVQGINRYLQ